MTKIKTNWTHTRHCRERHGEQRSGLGDRQLASQPVHRSVHALLECDCIDTRRAAASRRRRLEHSARRRDVSEASVCPRGLPREPATCLGNLQTLALKLTTFSWWLGSNILNCYLHTEKEGISTFFVRINRKLIYTFYRASACEVMQSAILAVFPFVCLKRCGIVSRRLVKILAPTETDCLFNVHDPKQ